MLIKRNGEIFYESVEDLKYFNHVGDSIINTLSDYLKKKDYSDSLKFNTLIVNEDYIVDHIADMLNTKLTFLNESRKGWRFNLAELFKIIRNFKYNFNDGSYYIFCHSYHYAKGNIIENSKYYNYYKDYTTIDIKTGCYSFNIIKLNDNILNTLNNIQEITGDPYHVILTHMIDYHGFNTIRGNIAGKDLSKGLLDLTQSTRFNTNNKVTIMYPGFIDEDVSNICVSGYEDEYKNDINNAKEKEYVDKKQYILKYALKEYYMYLKNNV
jgi:hypothetical protein